MATPVEFLVSASGQMSVPTAVRRRWGLDGGGRVTVIDLGDAVVLVPAGARQKLLADALSGEDHRRLVSALGDPDLATTYLALVVVDDHLLRDVMVGERPPDLGGVASDGIATTGLWLFRLCSSFADPTVAGKLSAPVAALPEELQAAFRAQLTALPPEIEVLPMRELAWSMAELQSRHGAGGRILSAAMAEALAAAHRLDGGTAVSTRDVGPNPRAAAEADDVAFHVL